MTLSLKQIRRDWEGAANDYTFGAFWFWNSDQEPGELRRRAAELAAAGFRYVVIHPIHGMTVEYLSDEYCAAFRQGLALLREFGLKAWIYDEFGWPSGNAGGLLLRRYPECAMHYLAFTRTPDGAVSAEVRRTDRVLDSVTGAPWCRKEEGYLDTLSAEAVDRFLELTHQRLWEAAGEALFRETVIGFFTDEPAAMLDNPGGHSLWEAEALPWTPELPKLFRERYQIDIAARYADLADDAKLRSCYRALAAELHAEHFYGRIAAWCHRHGVLFTGHAGEDFPGQASRFCGDIRRCFDRMDLPGIDYLGHAAHASERIGEMTLIGSIARRQGHDRVFCEAFGVSPVTVTPEHLLAESQAMGLFGVNDLGLMGIHQSHAGIRKHLYWPGFFDETAWFPAFRTLNRAVGRSLALCSAGEKVIRYAILYPQDHLNALPVLDYKVCEAREPVNAALDSLLLEVRRRRENADFIFAEDLAAATVTAEGQLAVGTVVFDALIAPECFHYDGETLKHLARLGNVVHAEVPALPADEPFRFRLLEGVSPQLHRYRFPDGELTAFHNGSDAPCRIDCRAASGWHGSLWQPVSGLVSAAGDELEIPPWGTLYWSATPEALAAAEPELPPLAPLRAQWRASLAAGNCELFEQVEFRRPGGAWLPGEAGETVPGNQRFPLALAGAETIEFRARFRTGTALTGCRLAWEAGRIVRLRLDGAELPLSDGRAELLWDHSCCSLACGGIPAGEHRIEGVAHSPAFESGMRNDGFFLTTPMPSLDLMLVGDFCRSAAGLVPFGTPYVELPLDSATLGLHHLPRALVLENSVEAPPTGGELTLRLGGPVTAGVRLGNEPEQFFLSREIRVKIPAGGGRILVRLMLYPSDGMLFGGSRAAFQCDVQTLTVEKELTR